MPRNENPKKPAFGGDSGTIGKALTIIRYFVDRQDSWGVRELAATLNQPQSSVHRILKILKSEGFLEFDAEHQRYQVGMEFFRVAAIINQRVEIARIATPYMRDLVEEVNETCLLSLIDLDEKRVIHVAAHECTNPLRYEPPVGYSENLTETAIGLAVLAFLPPSERARLVNASNATKEINRKLEAIELHGYALEVSEGKEAAARVAAPIMGAEDRPVAIMTVVIPSYRCDETGLEATAKALVAQARDLSRAMGSRFLGGGTGRTWHAGVAALAGIVGNRVSGLVATPALGGGRQNLEDVHAGRGAYCLPTLSSLIHAYQGVEPFQFRHDKLRAMLNVSTMDLQIVVRNELPIETFTDIAKYRISPGQKAFSTSETFHELLDVCGVSTRSISKAGGEIVHLDYVEARRQFLEGRIDVLVWFTGMPSILLHDLAPSTARMVELDPDVCATMIERCPAYTGALISKDTYPWLTRDITSLRVTTTMVAHADRSDDEVYQITRTVYEQREDLVIISNAFASLTHEFAMDVSQVPIHPGAQRYWDEIEKR